MRSIFLLLLVLLVVSPCHSRGLGTFRIDDYKAKVFLSQRGKYLYAEGSLNGRPKFDKMRLTVYAEANDGRAVTLVATITDVGRRRTYEVNKYVGRKKGSWHIKDVKLARVVN